MNFAEEILKLCKEMKVTKAELARRTAQAPQNLGRKLKSGSLSSEEFSRMLEALGVGLECRYTIPGREETEEKPAAADSEAQLRLTEHYKQRLALMQAELETERKKTAYYTGASHDIRTFLETISGSLYLAGQHEEDRAYVHGCIERIETAYTQLQDLLGIVMPENGTGEA